MNEAEIIKGAREILSDPSHWGKYGYSDGKGRYCLLGAIGMAAMNDAEAWVWNHHGESPLGRAVELVVKHLPGEVWVAEFNDTYKTTHQDVLNVLDKTLADLGALGDAE